MFLFIQRLTALFVLSITFIFVDFHLINASGSPGSMSELPIISRAQWGARTPKEEPTRIPDNLPYVFIHHTHKPAQCFDTPSCIAAVRGVQDFHIDSRGWNDIGYSFLIADDGNIYEGRGWNVQGAHTLHYNSIGYGIAIIGDFTSKLPTTRTLELLARLIDFAQSTGKIQTQYCLRGHRDAIGAKTDCPGNALYSLIQEFPNYLNQCPIPGKV